MSTIAKLPVSLAEFDHAITGAQTIGDVSRISTGIKSSTSLLPAEKVLLLTHAAEREQQILEYYLPTYSLTAMVTA
jgi:hypothetical protein